MAQGIYMDISDVGKMAHGYFQHKVTQGRLVTWFMDKNNFMDTENVNLTR